MVFATFFTFVFEKVIFKCPIDLFMVMYEVTNM